MERSTSTLLTRYLPSILITLVCVVFFIMGIKIGFTGSPCIRTALLYHFSHANIFHMLANMICLFQFHPRWKTCAVAFAAASVASFIPYMSMALPTYGLSAFLFAAYARKFATWRLNPWKLIAFNLLFIFIPVFNWKIHLSAFGISYLIWYGYSWRKKR